MSGSLAPAFLVLVPPDGVGRLAGETSEQRNCGRVIRPPSLRHLNVARGRWDKAAAEEAASSLLDVGGRKLVFGRVNSQYVPRRVEWWCSINTVESGLNSEIANSAGSRTFGSGGVPPGETVAVDGWISGTAEMEA